MAKKHTMGSGKAIIFRKNIKIAVIDTGVDTDVDGLENKITKTVSVATEDSKEDDNEHGTAISTIIAGSPQNDKGVLGVAPDASIVSIDITNDSEGTVTLNNLIKGINRAIEEKVDIINISIGTSEKSKELGDVINNAFKKGIIALVLEKRPDISGEDIVAYFNGKSQFDNVNVKQVLDDF